jgi:hypothetical protein
MSHGPILLALGIATATAADLTPLPLTKGDTAIQITTKNGDRPVAGREMLVDAWNRPGKSNKGDIFVLFDANSGVFYWRCWVLPDNRAQAPGIAKQLASKDERIYIADDKIVSISVRDQDLAFWESQRHAISLDDAETKALKEVGDHLPEIESDGLGIHGTAALVKLPLSVSFDYGEDPKHPGTAARSIPFPTAIVSVTHHDGKWELILENRWKAKVTLNDKYELQGWEKVP